MSGGQVCADVVDRVPLRALADEAHVELDDVGEAPAAQLDRIELLEALEVDQIDVALGRLAGLLHFFKQAGFSLGAMALDRIIARPVKEVGLGIAIMDRLRRCSATE